MTVRPINPEDIPKIASKTMNGNSPIFVERLVEALRSRTSNQAIDARLFGAYEKKARYEHGLYSLYKNDEDRFGNAKVMVRPPCLRLSWEDKWSAKAGISPESLRNLGCKYGLKMFAGRPGWEVRIPIAEKPLDGQRYQQALGVLVRVHNAR